MVKLDDFDDFEQFDDFDDDIEPPRYAIMQNKGKYEVWDMENDILIGRFKTEAQAEKHVEDLESR